MSSSLIMFGKPLRIDNNRKKRPNDSGRSGATKRLLHDFSRFVSSGSAQIQSRSLDVRYNLPGTSRILATSQNQVSHNQPQKSTSRSIEPRTDFKNLTITKVDRDQLGPDDIIIAVMGPTGVGKSSFISKAIGREVGIGHGLEGETTQVTAIRATFRDEVKVVLVDTPGFDDTYRSDLDILQLISDWLRKTYEKGFELSGILYLHCILDNRMDNTPSKNLNMFQKLCGKEAFEKVILTTTMWPDADRGDCVAREDELKQSFWAEMVKRGSRVLRFENTQQSAWCILSFLVGLSSQRRSIQIQRELVDLRKDLPSTEAGKELHGVIEKLIEKQNDIIGRMKEELTKTSDPDVVSVLVRELNELREERNKAVRDMRKLKFPLLERLRQSFGGFWSK